jgi:hypothetical protein
LLLNKSSELGEVILFGNEAKNAGIAELRRGFLTKLAGKRTSLNGAVISQQALRVLHPSTICFPDRKKLQQKALSPKGILSVGLFMMLRRFPPV